VSHGDWIGIGVFGNYASALVVSRLLTDENVPHRVVGSPAPGRDPECYIWVPPDWLDRAKKVLADAQISDDELTRQALSYPPPDDAV
jgi:hypothetical protein